MNFQNSILNFERTDARTDGQAQSNMLLQLFQSWGGIKKLILYANMRIFGHASWRWSPCSTALAPIYTFFHSSLVLA